MAVHAPPAPFRIEVDPRQQVKNMFRPAQRNRRHVRSVCQAVIRLLEYEESSRQPGTTAQRVKCPCGSGEVRLHSSAPAQPAAAVPAAAADDAAADGAEALRTAPQRRFLCVANEQQVDRRGVIERAQASGIPYKSCALCVFCNAILNLEFPAVQGDAYPWDAIDCRCEDCQRIASLPPACGKQTFTWPHLPCYQAPDGAEGAPVAAPAGRSSLPLCVTGLPTSWGWRRTRPTSRTYSCICPRPRCCRR